MAEVTQSEHTEQHVDARPRRYVEIAVVLGALIAVELALFYGRDFGLRRDVATWGILLAAALKVVLATAWFMDLRTEHAFYRHVFVGGAVLGGVVFAAALLIMFFGAPPS